MSTIPGLVKKLSFPISGVASTPSDREPCHRFGYHPAMDRSSAPPTARRAERRSADPDGTRSGGRSPLAPTSAGAGRPRAAPGRAATRPSDSPGRDPVASILHAAGELLDEVGAEGLNTTAVARRAGISTATLYRHFPDKRAVLNALVRAVHEERARAVAGYYERFAREADWRVPLAEGLRLMYRMRIERPGGRSTRRALQTSPELWAWDKREDEALARALARAMRQRRPRLGKAEAERIAMTVVTATVALLDLACLDARRAPAMLEEAAALREAYLARYLD